MQIRTLALAAAMMAAGGWASAATTTSHSASKASSQTLTGTIESYDATAQTLNVKTSKGSEAFSTSGAKVWSGSKSVTLDQLSSDVGAKVKVTYHEKDGHKTAMAIHVTAPSSKSAR